MVSVLFVGICFGGVAAQAWNATWLLSPRSSDWNTAANWTPALVPAGTATFGASHTTTITFSENTSVGALHFTTGAPAYFLDLSGFSLKITGTGVAVESGVIQPTLEDFKTLNFNGGSTAGTAIINNFGGETQFLNTSTAGAAGVNNNAGRTIFSNTSRAGSAFLNNTNSGETDFLDTSRAGSAGIINNGGLTAFKNAATADTASITNFHGMTSFFNASTAANSTISNLFDGFTNFFDTSTAAHSIITNNDGGKTEFLDTEHGRLRDRHH